MRRSSVYAVLGTLGLLVEVAALGPVAADQRPAGCNGNNLAVDVSSDRTVVRNGDVITYTLTVSNLSTPAARACDVTGATVALTLPAADGSPSGETLTLATDQNYPAGTPHTVVGTRTYTVAVNSGVDTVTARASTPGTLHRAPSDDAVTIIKTLSTTVTEPAATLVKVAVPVTGQAPLSVTYTYTLTNASPTGSAIREVSLVDDNCSPVSRTGGDANANNVLEVTETWTFTCTRSFTAAGTFPNVSTATGTDDVDSRPVPIAPARASVTVTAAPTPAIPTNVMPAQPISAEPSFTG